MRTLPHIYSQRDPQWAGQRLGTVDGTTIGSEGCFVTSFAMLACYYGHSVTPNQLDDIFTNNGWYVSGNLMVDTNLQRAFPDIVYKESPDYSSVPADLGRLQTLLADPTTSVVLEVDFSPEQAGLQTHFVVAVDCDGTNVTIADPWTGTIRSVSDQYGKPETTIQKFVIYQGKPPSLPAAITQQEVDDLRAARDKNWNLYQADENMIQELNKEIGDKNTQIDSLNQQIASLKAAQSPTAPIQTPTGTDAVTIQNLKTQVDGLTQRSSQLLAALLKIKAIAYGGSWFKISAIKAIIAQAGA